MSITRVQYRERQRLTAADLRAEQDYRLGLGGRHHLTLHDWGVVRGLRVIANQQGGFTLTRGVAIDGYGREILVPEPVDLAELDKQSCTSVLLYYCERPAQVPPDRRCEDDPAPRIGQRVTVGLEEEFVPAAMAFEDVGLARAAGPLSGLRPWPVVVARVGMACSADESSSLEDYSMTRYVRARASVLRSPTGRALMQLGLLSRIDVFHFLLSTRDDGKGMSRRVGVDRDGTTHVWRPLVISGAQAAAKIALAQNQMLEISVDMPGGIGRRMQVSGVIDSEKRTLSASLISIGGFEADQTPAFEKGRKLGLKDSKVALTLGTHVASFQMMDATASPVAFFQPAGKKKKASPPPPPPAPLKAFSVLLKPTGGKLVMQVPSGSPEAAAAECGGLVRFRADSGQPGIPVVQFRPASEMKADPLAREIHAVTTSKPTDAVPRTELRLSGGGEDDTDVSSRFSVGAWVHQPGKAVWLPVLRMDGGRRLDILTAPGVLGPTARLHVDGAVYLPPIGKKDPLLTDMMAMAFIAGLRLMGRVPIATATVVAKMPPPATPPPTILRGETLQYTLTTKRGNAVPKRCVEIIRGTAGTADMAFRSIPLSQVTESGTTISTPNFTHTASKVVVEVLILVAEGNVSKVVVSNSLELSVGD